MKQLIPVYWGRAGQSTAQIQVTASWKHAPRFLAGNRRKQCGPKSGIPQIEPWFPSFPLNFQGDLTCFLFRGLPTLWATLTTLLTSWNHHTWTSKMGQQRHPKMIFPKTTMVGVQVGVSWGFDLHWGPAVEVDNHQPLPWLWNAHRRMPSAAKAAPRLAGRGPTVASQSWRWSDPPISNWRQDIWQPAGPDQFWPNNAPTTHGLVPSSSYGVAYILWGYLTQRLYEITMQLYAIIASSCII